MVSSWTSPESVAFLRGEEVKKENLELIQRIQGGEDEHGQDGTNGDRVDRGEGDSDKSIQIPLVDSINLGASRARAFKQLISPLYARGLSEVFS